jgi:radical SAM superfamily enzyme YgiQ (UPF0313 family)
MKVMLIQPVPPPAHWPRGLFRSHWVPTGLASIAAVLRQAGCDVRLHIREQQLDQLGMNRLAADAQLEAELRSFGPQLVGLGLMTPHLPEAAEIAALARRVLGDNAIIVAGGVHPSAMPAQTLAFIPQLDAVVIGEGEETMLEVASRGPGRDVPGLALRGGGSGGANGEDAIIRTPPRPGPADLDALPAPPYDLLDMDWFTARSPWMIRWLPLRATNVRTSRGCVARCRFCAGYVVAGPGIRLRSIDSVVEQIDRAATDFNLDAIHFEDDTLAADADRLVELCRALRARKLDRLKWDACLRVEQARPELLAEMKAAGCVQIEYGLETGSDAMLRNLGKGATLAQARSAIAATRRAGIRIFADIMLGLPGETTDDWEATIRLLRWARPEVISASVLCPLPGTPLFETLDADTRESLDWGSYTWLDEPGLALNLTDMSDEQLAGRYRRLRDTVLTPRTRRELLRDLGDHDPALAGKLRRRLKRFAMRHPLAYLRMP